MDSIEKLQQMGFSEYEAKTYLALLKENPATGYQISKISGVPRSMVYEVLSRLRSKGAVLETIEGRSTFYRPLPPEILLNQHKNYIQDLISSLLPTLKDLHENYHDNKVWSIVERDAIYAYSNQMLLRATTEVNLVVNDQVLSILEKELEELYKRGINLNILLTGSRKIEFGNIAYHPPLESEIQGLTDTFLLLVDNREVLVANVSNEARATITTNANLVLIAKQFVWMEFFTQKIYSQIGDELLSRLDPDDKEIFLSMVHQNSQGGEIK